MSIIKSHKYGMFLASCARSECYLSLHSKEIPRFYFRRVLSRGEMDLLIDLIERFFIKIKKLEEGPKEKDYDNPNCLSIVNCFLDDGSECILECSDYNAGTFSITTGHSNFDFAFNRYDAEELLKVLKEWQKLWENLC